MSTETYEPVLYGMRGNRVPLGLAGQNTRQTFTIIFFHSLIHTVIQHPFVLPGLVLMTSNNSLPAVTCAENIGLLSLLHSVPIPPSRNPTDNVLLRQEGYTLSFLRERSLAGTLAFLSSLKDGPDHIPAVCVEERPDPSVLNVLLAVNKAKPGDGKEVLKDLKLGFERIFTLLSQVSNGK